MAKLKKLAALKTTLKVLPDPIGFIKIFGADTLSFPIMWATMYNFSFALYLIALVAANYSTASTFAL